MMWPHFSPSPKQTGCCILEGPNDCNAHPLLPLPSADLPNPPQISPYLPILPISPHSRSLSPRWPATSDGRHNSGCTRDMLPINRILISREIWSTKVKVRAKVRLCQLPLLVLPVVEPVECAQPSKQWHHTVSLLLNNDQEWTKMLNILYDVGN